MGRKNAAAELAALEEGLQHAFSAPVQIRMHRQDGQNWAYAAHMCIRAHTHIDVDLDGRRYAISCDNSVTERLQERAHSLFARMGYARDNSVKPC